MSALFRCRALGRTFGAGAAAVTAVAEATCRIEPGDRIAVSGASGSGKSTLLHLIAGLETPTSGEAEWPGLGGDPRRPPGAVAMVFQAPSLLPALDVTENVSLPLLLCGHEPAEARKRAIAALELLGLDELAGRLPEEISGGQAQRVVIARAIATRPVLLLADEPTGQLDTGTAAAVLDVLLAAAAHLDAALVVATHDEDVAARLGTRWHMRDGHLRTGWAAPC
ncbi:ABC transporter ATP-binding protein [Longispora fulva]|uniref:ABC-type lipoprotein export system ATPase subunit n=1 Tax=Longispora fulva TaxID=619741 RepID=A0A8J7G9I1_9ACTN|nr:ATP-binding cassette domain-containing protein [Longispora fulva]MBG6136248.1 ABC-type lipoprotein export system ATPase subunit [Longispora fulva]GIG63430.1 ABC transporter ATP-binding protein [Longispora fulva]